MLLMSTIFIIVFVFLAVSIYAVLFDRDKIGTYTSPDGEYSLAFQKVGEPFFIDEDVGVLLKVTKNKKVVSKYIFHAEDGALNQACCDPVWYSDRVEVFLCEQLTSFESNPIILYFDKRSDEEKTIAFATSPNGKHSLEFICIGSDAKDASSYEVKFKLRYTDELFSDTRRAVIYQNEITPESWNVLWYEDRAEIFVLPQDTQVDGDPLTIYFRDIVNSENEEYEIDFQRIGMVSKSENLYKYSFTIRSKSKPNLSRRAAVKTSNENMSPDDFRVYWYDDCAEIVILDGDSVTEEYANPIKIVYP